MALIVMGFIAGFFMLGTATYFLWSATPIVFCADDEYVPKWYLSKKKFPLLARAGIWEIFLIAMGVGCLVSSTGVLIYEYLL